MRRTSGNGLSCVDVVLPLSRGCFQTNKNKLSINVTHTPEHTHADKYKNLKCRKYLVFRIFGFAAKSSIKIKDFLN